MMVILPACRTQALWGSRGLPDFRGRSGRLSNRIQVQKCCTQPRRMECLNCSERKVALETLGVRDVGTVDHLSSEAPARKRDPRNKP